MATNIYLVRHGEVENPKDVEYMRLPGFGLTENGKKQAETLKEFFEDKKIDVIYSSPLKRTKDTAKIISAGKIPVKYNKGIIEVNYKKWQGKKRSERAYLKEYRKDPVKYSAVLGESLHHVQRRIIKELCEITEKNRGKNVIVVFHAAPIITARLFFEKRPLSDFHQVIVKHASVTLISLDNELECRGVTYSEYAKAKEWQD